MDAVISQSPVETPCNSMPVRVHFSLGHRRLATLLLLCCALGCQHLAFCQESSTAAEMQDKQVPGGSTPAQTAVMERKVLIDFIHDQKDIWTSPLKARRKDLFWIVPSGILVGGLMYRDVD